MRKILFFNKDHNGRLAPCVVFEAHIVSITQKLWCSCDVQCTPQWECTNKSRHFEISLSNGNWLLTTDPQFEKFFEAQK